MKKWLWMSVLGLFCHGIQANILAQAFLPDSEAKIYYDVGNPTVRLVLHPVGWIVVPPTRDYSEFAEYDIFVATNPAANLSNLNPDDWSWIRRTRPGETNLVLKNIWPEKPIFAFGTILDSDNDGLPDAFEMLVSKTNPHKYDSVKKGVSDGDEMGPNGLPWNLEQQRRTDVVIYANLPDAAEGGSCGQCTVYLPAPAPVGGETVYYRFGGLADPGTDFTISPASGSWNNYSMNITSGSRSGIMSVCAIDDNKYSGMDRYTTVTLTGSKDYPVSGIPAQVNIIDNDLPAVRVFALPPNVDEPFQVYGTTHIEFYFIRDGDVSNAVIVNFNLNATVAFWNGHNATKAKIKFPAGMATRSLPVVLKQYKVDKLYDSITLKITSAPGYQIDPTNGSAKITIVNHYFRPVEKSEK